MRNFSKLLFLLALFLLSACAAGRPAIPLGQIPAAPVPTSDENAQAVQFKEALAQSGLQVHDRRYVDRVERITRRILSVIHTSHSWDLYVVRDDSFNAATLLGSIIFVNTGLLDMFPGDDEVAAIMGHEVAHSLASHFRRTEGEQVNEFLAALLGVAAGSVASHHGATEQEIDEAAYVTHMLFKGAMVHPHSHEREREADRIGLFIMADAGYDPSAAVRVWDHLAREEGYSGNAFFSTHPLSAERADLLRQILPAALQRYHASQYNANKQDITIGTNNNSSIRGTHLGLLQGVRTGVPKTVSELLSEGRNQFSGKKYSEAENTFRDVLSRDSKNREAIYLLGASLLEQNKNKEAERQLLKAVSTNFRSAEPAYYYARAKARLGDKNNAIVYLTRACSLDSSLRSRAATESDFQLLRGDSRFQNILTPNPGSRPR